MSHIAKHGHIDDIETKKGVLARLNRLDEIYATVVREGNLRPFGQAAPWAFREYGGVLVHIGPGGRPYFGGAGQHRMAIALALGLQRIPAQLGATHSDAIRCLGGFRRRD